MYFFLFFVYIYFNHFQSAPKAAAASESSSAFSAQFASGSSGLETSGSADFGVAGAGFSVSSGEFAAGGAEFGAGGAVASGSSFESSSFGQQDGANFGGFEATQGVGLAHDFSSSYESSAAAGVQGGDASASGYESFGGSTDDASNPVVAAFNAADTNKDGGLDVEEFRRFVSSNLGSQ